MRPRPVIGEATVPDAVRRLLDKFDYPDRESPAQVIPILPTLGAGGGGAPTVVIAAANATDQTKESAHLQATGTNDYATFQAANDLISGPRGRILVSEGSFDLGTTEVNLNPGITLQGMGAGSTYIYGEAATMLFDVASQCQIYDIYFDQGTNGAGCVDIVGGQASAIKNCQFENVDSTGWMVRHSAGGHLTVEGCLFDGSGDGIITSGNGGRFINVTNNFFLQTNRGLYFPAADIYNIHVIGNTFQQTEEWGLYIDASNGIIIANNDFASCGQTANGALWINTALGTIIGNKFDSTRNGPDIQINGSRQVTVEGNTSETAFQDGLLLEDSDNCVVTGNVWLLDGHDAANTYDAIAISGASDRNLITANMLVPPTVGNSPRYGVNIGGTGECNMVVGNDLGDPNDYGTDALVDTASNTQLFWPNDATYGDNFTDCGSGS